MAARQQRASRRPVVAAVVVGLLLIAFGFWQSTQPVRCGDDRMLPGDSCLVLDGGASRTLTYEESAANHERNPTILVAAGAVVIAAGVVGGLLLGRRVDSPKGQAERQAWEQAIAANRRRLVESGHGDPRALAEVDSRAAKERRARRYPPLPAGGSGDGPGQPGQPGQPRQGTPQAAVNRTSGVSNEPAQRRGPRRPVIRLVLLGVVLLAGGLLLWSSTEPACRGQAMGPGETCTVNQGRTTVERTAEEVLQTQRTPARALMYAGGAAVVLSVPLGLVRGRRLRPLSDADQAAWDAELAHRRDVPPSS